MKKIAFYISGRRESVVRCAAIINTMLQMESELEIYIKTDPLWIEKMQKLTKQDDRVLYDTVLPDVGYWEWDGLIKDEKDFLINEKIGLIVSDLCPWIHLAADELRIKNILVADFTWGMDCSEKIDENILDSYTEAYEAVSKLILYDVHMTEMETLVENVEPVSLAALPYDMELIWDIQSKAKGPIVFVEREKDLPTNVAELPYYFICQEEKGIYRDAGNVLSVNDYMNNMHNYVAASEYVISRPRWDVVSYGLLANKKAAYYSNACDRVEKNRIDIIKERGHCIEISEEESKNILKVIEMLDSFPYNYDLGYHNDDYTIAKNILDFYPKKHRNRKNREEEK